MLHALALILGGLAAALVLTAALALGGPPAAPPNPQTAPADAAGALAAQPRVQVDTVYLAPPPPPRTVTVQRTVPPSRGEHEDDEGGSDD
jgi:multidrug efflux pump subunit AcrA (membrane-fusion protein)